MRDRRRRFQKEPRGVLEVSLKRNETSDSLIRRFKRAYKQTGLQDDIRKSTLRFKSKSEKKREKHLRAVRRSQKNQVKL
jgi:ribosomal protein S21